MDVDAGKKWEDQLVKENPPPYQGQGGVHHSCQKARKAEVKAQKGARHSRFNRNQRAAQMQATGHISPGGAAKKGSQSPENARNWPPTPAWNGPQHPPQIYPNAPKKSPV